MIIYYILFIILVYNLIHHYKKTVLTYIPLRIILHQGIILWPANPTLIFDSAAIFTIIILYYAGYNNKYKTKFPFTIPLVIFFISEFCSSFFTNTSGATLAFIQEIVVNVFFLYIIWQLIRNSEDIKIIIKGYTILFSLAILISIYEQIFHNNPIIDLEVALLPNNAPKGLIWPSHQIRFGGLFRSQAFMPISITYGAYCLLFFIFFLQFSTRYPLYTFYSKTKNILFNAGLFLGAFLSGSKAPIISLGAGILPYIKIQWLKKWRLIIILPIVILLARGTLKNIYNDIYQSMTVEESYEYGGSSLAMRIIQFQISLDEFKKSPIIGNGKKTLGAVMEQNSDLFGAESIWFGLMIEKGLLGIFAFLLLIFYPVFTKKIKDKKIIIALSISYLTINTLTTIPGLNISFYYTLLIILKKTQLLESQRLCIKK